jgi:hypothetical protein
MADKLAKKSEIPGKFIVIFLVTSALGAGTHQKRELQILWNRSVLAITGDL